VDVATNNSENLARLEVTAPDKRALIKVIWTSPLIPSDPLVWRKDLDPAAKAAIDKFLMGYGQDSREKKIMEDLQWKGFKKSDNKQLIPIRQLELFKTKSKVESDEKMPAAEKKAALAEIEKRLADLEKAGK
jgi:phosphonate transport system substrate-binding protein